MQSQVNGNTFRGEEEIDGMPFVGEYPCLQRFVKVWELKVVVVDVRYLFELGADEGQVAPILRKTA